MNRFLNAAFLLATLVCVEASAGVVEVGALTLRNFGDSSVYDSLNGREWLRWDQVGDLSYAQTVDAIGAGGAYEGWSIATISDAQLFIDALLGTPNGCDEAAITAHVTCGSVSGGPFVALMGDAFPVAPTSQHAFFLSDNGEQQSVGLISRTALPNRVTKNNEFASIAVADSYSPTGVNGNIGFALFRTVDVPAPSPLAILLVGLLGSRRAVRAVRR